MRVRPAFLVPLKDLGEIHLLVHGEGHEPHGMGVGELVDERGLDLVEVVDADGELAPLPADGYVQLLLKLHHGPEELVIYVDASDNPAEEPGSELLHARVDGDLHVPVGDLVPLHPGLDVQECAQRPGKTLDAVEVGAVREELDAHVLASRLGVVHVGTDHRDPLDQRLLGNLLPQHVAQVAVLEVDQRHDAPIGDAL